MDICHLPYLTISGQPYSRGRQYGLQAAPLIIHSIASYARLFAYRRGLDWNAVQTAALAYIPVLEEHAAEILEEMRGIADGAGLQLAEIIALNARTELLAGPRRDSAHPDYASAIGRNDMAGIPDHGECTVVAALPAVTASGKTLLAQTWDWIGDQRAACVLLHVQSPGRPDILTLTEAGIVAKIGLNSSGLGVCLDILHTRLDGEKAGMPIHVLLRLILEGTSITETLSVVEQMHVAASSCISVADENGYAVSIEVIPSAIGVREPYRGLLVHTNRCLVECTQLGECEQPPSPSSIARYDRATELLTRSDRRLDCDDLIALLRDHQGEPNCICRHPDINLHPAARTETVIGVVMDVSSRVMQVAPGLPCRVSFETIKMRG